MSNEREKYLKSIDKSLKNIDKSLARIAKVVDDEPEQKDQSSGIGYGGDVLHPEQLEKKAGSAGMSAEEIQEYLDNEDQELRFAAAAEINEDDRNYRRG